MSSVAACTVRSSRLSGRDLNVADDPRDHGSGHRLSQRPAGVKGCPSRSGASGFAEAEYSYVKSTNSLASEIAAAAAAAVAAMAVASLWG